MTDTASKPTPGRQPLTGPPPKQGLYDPQYEHDSCGVGFLVNMKGRKSHEIVQQALQILVNLDHRGACGCESNTGDGAGILLQTPHAFLREAFKECTSPRPSPQSGEGDEPSAAAPIQLPAPGHYACGLIFLPPDREERADCEQLFEKIIAEEGQKVLGWRTVPTNNSSLGETAKASEPCIRQIFIERNASHSGPLPRSHERSHEREMSDETGTSGCVRVAGIRAQALCDP